jgi:cell wall-associated NlpC family hydrolase
LRARALTTTIVTVLAVPAAAAPASAQAPEPPAPAAPAPPPPAPAAPAPAPPAPAGAATGGTAYAAAAPQPVVAGGQATIVDGLAQAPADAPPAVQQVIVAANEIVGKPYRYGGGHRLGFKDRGYDCSGTVSYALHGALLLKRPLDSRGFMRWGASGPGTWITVYANRGHAFVVVAGLRLDTSAAGDPSGLRGPRWRPALRSTKGFKARHPVGL